MKIKDIIDFIYNAESNNIDDVLLDLTKTYIHFEFKDKSSINKAFIYDWRLWSLPEIKECLLESGFKQVDIYMQGWDDEKDEETDDFYKTKTCDADPGWLAYIIATKQ